MVQFAEVLSKVGAEFAQTAEAKPGVRVSTAGWDSWLKADDDDRSVGERLARAYVLDDEAPEPEVLVEQPDIQPIKQAEKASPHAQEPPAPPAPPAPPPLDLAAELARERLLTLSDLELRALRRRLARRVHPDLPNADRPDLASMVRVNVAIDAALRLRRANLR